MVVDVRQRIGKDLYVLFEDGKLKYDISAFDSLVDKYVYATDDEKKSLSYYINSSQYEYLEEGGNNYIEFVIGFPVNDFYSFKILDVEPDFDRATTITTMGDINPTTLNAEFDNIKDYTLLMQEVLSKKALRYDAEYHETMLPKLEEGDVWVMGRNYIEAKDSKSLEYILDNDHITDLDNPHKVSLEQARAKSNVLSGDIDFNNNDAIGLEKLSFTNGQPINWNSKYKTMEVPFSDGSIIKLGIDTMFEIHNATGGTLKKGDVVYPAGTSTNGVTNVIKAIADTHETLRTLLGVIPHEILDGNDGHVMISGVIDPIDTSLLSEGIAFLSSTVEGGLTSTKPDWTNYEVVIGVIDTSSPTGVLTVDLRFDLKNTLTNFWNGVFREGFNFSITSDGEIVTGTMTPKGDNVDQTMIFSDGFSLLDTSHSATIQLVEGTDTNPQINYVFVPRSTKVLTVSTSGFPEEEHIKVGTSLLQSATRVSEMGALKNHNFNDHIRGTNGQGHLSHITERLRTLEATWESGAEGSLTGLPTNAYVSVTSGVIYQLHQQSFPSISMPTSNINVVNDFVTPYEQESDLLNILDDALGNALLNTSFSLVIWGVANKTSEPSHLMCNLPIGTYSKNTPELAVNDAQGYSVYTIPKEFRGTGFLIARFTFIDTNGVWVLEDTQDLRGKLANTSAGGVTGGGSGVTTMLGLTDTPSTYTGNSLDIARVNTGETALEFAPQYNNGTTLERPTITQIGFAYFDTTLSIPIWWDGSNWVNSTGTIV